MNLTTLTFADLAKITNLLKAKESLLAKVAAIDQQLTAFESGGVVKTGPKISAAGRARIAAAMKKRWAKIKAGKTAKPVAKKRKMSAKGRANIAAAAKAMWAKRNAEKAKKK